MKFCQQRLASLLNALQVVNIEEFRPLNLVANLATLISTYFKGFTVIIEPYPDKQIDGQDLYDPLL